MDLHIVNGPAVPGWSDPRYRGVWRDQPTYCNTLPADHEVNKLFVDWYLVEGGESGIVHDLHRAVYYATLCNKHFPGQFFEIVEVPNGDAPPEVGRRFLGYDLLSHGAASVMHGGHQSWTAQINIKSPADILWRIMRLYLEPRLNEFRLFQRIDDASLCLDSMIALQEYEPAYFEGGDLRVFRPMGVYLVWGQDNWPPVPGGEAHWQEGAKQPGAAGPAPT